MNTTWRAILALVVVFAAGFLMGSWTDLWPSSATAEVGEAEAKFLRVVGHQRVGRNLLFSVYCDAERGHLMYTYTLAGGDVPNGNLVVLKDGCKGGK
jgi:hypothetical protein